MTMFLFFFFNDTATTEIYTLSLHDALPIWRRRDRALRDGLEPRDAGERRGGHARPGVLLRRAGLGRGDARRTDPRRAARDRKSTRLNSSHANISYAVFCLKKKKNQLSTSHH